MEEGHLPQSPRRHQLNDSQITPMRNYLKQDKKHSKEFSDK